MTRLFALTALSLAVHGFAGTVRAQEADEAGTITARVRGTFQDRTAGLGVVSGDMTIVRFEIRSGELTAVAKIVGAMADSAGNVLGPVDHEVIVPVANVASTCNQLRMDLGAADADLLGNAVHFDAQVAGYDSRNGAIPKALGVLCAAGELLRTKPSPASVANALNGIVAEIRPKPSVSR
ncbi:MAG TPA: hypothetical protein VH740_17955 [Vicinamibacterales bacterium]|jgi:hypothetical protein